MNIKRIFVCAVIIWIVGILYFFLTCGGLFKWVYDLPPTNIWKDPAVMMKAANFILMYLSGILSAFLFTLVFAIFYKGIPGNGIKKGIIYGVLLWLVGALSGMITMPLYMNIAVGVVVYWIISALIFNIISGVIVGAIYKEK